MSADRWSICPKCTKIAKEQKATLKTKVETAYGKVSEQEYHRLLESAGKRVDLEETLRENFDIGIWDDQFQVSYSGSCEKCGFKKEFKTQSLIEI